MQNAQWRPKASPGVRRDSRGAVDWSANAAVFGGEESPVAKGQEKPGKTNKPKVTTKAKQAKKAEKKAAAS